MVDGVDDLSEVRQNPPEQAIELTPPNAQGAVVEIALEQNFKVTLYGTELGGESPYSILFFLSRSRGDCLYGSQGLGLLKPLSIV